VWSFTCTSAFFFLLLNFFEKIFTVVFLELSHKHTSYIHLQQDVIMPVIIQHVCLIHHFLGPQLRHITFVFKTKYQPFCVRSATQDDLEVIMQLKKESWSSSMQQTRECLSRRLETIPARIYVLEQTSRSNDEKKILGVIQTQRMNGVASIRSLDN
jgi:hypothetical protein